MVSGMRTLSLIALAASAFLLLARGYALGADSQPSEPAPGEAVAPAPLSRGEDAGAGPEDVAADDEGAPPPALRDPLEPVNRVFFTFNDKAYFWVMKPVARGYRAAVPEPVRVSVRNFFSNLAAPIRLVNNLLQGRIRDSGTTLARFVINSTIGIGGLFDPAKKDFHLRPRDEDLGQTLGSYGLGHGLYIVLPLLGPSSLRDAAGLAGDAFLDPVNYLDGPWTVLAVHGFKTENEVSLRIGEYEDLKASAVDPYVALRNAYAQHRARKVLE